MTDDSRTNGDLESALSAYLSFVHKCFKAVTQVQSEPSEGLKVMMSRAMLLKQGLEIAEDHPEYNARFNTLVDSTARSFCGGKPDVSQCKENVQVYFRLSGVYEALFDGQELDRNEMFRWYCEAFQAKSDTITHLAPVDRLTLEASTINCRGFQIRKLSQEELDGILRNRARQIFFPRAYINTKVLSQYFFICAVERGTAYKPGQFVSDWYGNRVFPAFRKGRDSQYPALVESALRCLALYDWDGDYHNPDKPNPVLEAVRREYPDFTIP